MILIAISFLYDIPKLKNNVIKTSLVKKINTGQSIKLLACLEP